MSFVSFNNLPNPSTNVLAIKQQQPPPLVDLDVLQAASRVLQEQLLKDAQIIPDHGEMFAYTGSSGQYSVFPDDYRVPFLKRKLAGIPEGLFQYFTAANTISHMGLMPEIDRVWVTIDNKLFLWDYVEGEEISSFSDQPDVITYVATVQPKPGVFIDEISQLLVLCTPISVLLIGVSVSPVTGQDGRAHKEIKMYATDMSVSTDVEMTSVAGTVDGRIFMCGSQDGCLYELHYQEKEGWFGKRVQLINHSVGGVQTLFPKLMGKSDDRVTSVVVDKKRNVFYTLSSSSTISVYKTSGDKAVQHLQTLSNIYKLAQDKALSSPALSAKNFSIVSIQVIDPVETRGHIQLHLMAITTNGVRLFFSPQASLGGYGYSSAPGAYKTLGVQHVRLPPTNLLHPDEQTNPIHSQAMNSYALVQANPPPTASRPYILSAIENASYFAGLTIATQQGDVDTLDYILLLSPDLPKIGSFGQPQQPPTQQVTSYQVPSYSGYAGPQGSQRPPLTEQATLLPIPGRTWAMCPAPRDPNDEAYATHDPVVTNELVYQFTEPTREFIVMTNVGLSFLAKRRPIDALKVALEEAMDNNTGSIVHFRDSYGRDQTCAMLLAIAAGNTFLDVTPKSVSTALTLRNGLGGLGISKGPTVQGDLSNTAKQVFYDFGERPMWAERSYVTTPNSGTAIFSGRREGLAIYFCRLVRPFWKSKLVKPAAFGLNESAVHENVYITAQKNLYALKDLLDTNPQLFHSTPGDQAGARGATASEQEAWKAEQSSVSQMLSLLTRTIEAISFVLLLIDHRWGELIAQCDPSVQKSLSEMCFEDLVISQNGVIVSRALVNVVIDQQIGQQISVDTISDVLQQRCGSFCSTDDVMLYKAKENVRKAIETRSLAERQNWLGEALRLLVKGARVLEFDKLGEICGHFQELNFAKGVVELPLRCAQTADPDSVGREYWHEGSLDASDPRAKFWELRKKCYDLVLQSLHHFEEKSAGSSKAPSTGQTDDPEVARSHAYELAFSSEDELFHSTLYDWLISRGLADELLEMRPAYLEAHLKREPGTVEKYQLLWQFYVKDGQPLRAAEVLAALAKSTAFDLTLDARLEYLTLAVGNAKSHPIAVGGRHEDAISFLTELEEELEVAQVQLELYHTLAPRINEGGEVGEKIKFLTTRLFNVTELYQGWAEPFDLVTMKLLIYHVSEHRDDKLVRPLWSRIFDETLEGVDPSDAADRLVAKVVPLGQRFYPSECAFPLRHVANLLVRFALASDKVVPGGWAPRTLIQCGVAYPEIWDILHGMYESQIPPFNQQQNVQAISCDIAVLLNDWLEEAKRSRQSHSYGSGLGSSVSGVGAGVREDEFPVFRIDQAIDQYLAELEPSRTETKAMYEGVKRQLRRSF